MAGLLVRSAPPALRWPRAVLLALGLSLGLPRPAAAQCEPDFNRDGNADQADVAALVNVVAGGDCP